MMHQCLHFVLFLVEKTEALIVHVALNRRINSCFDYNRIHVVETESVVAVVVDGPKMK